MKKSDNIKTSPISKSTNPYISTEYKTFGYYRGQHGWHRVVNTYKIEGETHVLINQTISEPEIRSIAIDKLKVEIVNEMYNEV